MEDVMKEIEKYGTFFYIPERWNEETNREIAKLRAEGRISSLKDEGIKFANESYIFIKKGNSDNVIVVTKNNLSWLVPKEKIDEKHNF